MFNHVYSDSLLGDTDTLVCPFAACVNQVPLYLLLKTLTQLSKMVFSSILVWVGKFVSRPGKV